MTKAEKVIVWGSTAVMTGTGIVIAWMEYVLTAPQPWAVVNHPWQPFILKLHIISAPVMVFGIGMISMRHIWPHFKNGLKKGRRSGIWNMLLAIPMIGTGYALQALSNAGWLQVMGYLHFALGTIFGAIAFIHFLATARKTRQAPPKTSATPRWRRRRNASTV
jgi:hypothetical protein